MPPPTEGSILDDLSDGPIPPRDPSTGLFPPLNLPVHHYNIDGRPYVLMTPERLVKNRELFTPRADDVIVATYPRNGTALTLSLCMHIHMVQNPDLPPDHPFYMDGGRGQTPWVHNKLHDTDKIENMPGPRVFKTHNYYMHLNVDPGSCKIIHVYRNPKDVICSQFHHMNPPVPYLAKMFEFEGSFSDCCDYFLDGGLENGCYWQFNREFLDNKDGHTMLHLNYEELTLNKREGIRRINNFLGYPEMSEEQVDQVVKATTLVKLRENQVGKPGRAREMLTVEQRERFDDKCRREFEGYKGIPESYFSESAYMGQS
eukprot:sb/3466987/